MECFIYSGSMEASYGTPQRREGKSFCKTLNVMIFFQVILSLSRYTHRQIQTI